MRVRNRWFNIRFQLLMSENSKVSLQSVVDGQLSRMLTLGLKVCNEAGRTAAVQRLPTFGGLVQFVSPSVRKP